MGWKLIKEELVPVTEDLAIQFCKMEKVPGERPIRAAITRDIAAHIDRGEHKPFEWTYALVDGKKFRINGQHTSLMFRDDPHLIRPGMMARVCVYKCDTLEDAATLWGIYDSQRSARTKGDVCFSAFSSFCYEQRLQVPSARIFAKAQAGIMRVKWIDNRGLTSKTSAEDANLIVKSHEFVFWFAEEFKQDKFRQRAVVSFAYATWLNLRFTKFEHMRFRDAYDRFWNEILKGTSSNPQDVTRLAREWVLEKRCNSIKSDMAATEQAIAGCLFWAWNAYMNRKKLTKVRPMASEAIEYMKQAKNLAIILMKQD